MFIVNDRTHLRLRSEERQNDRINVRTVAALPNGAEDRGDVVAINMTLLRSGMAAGVLQ
jgi:hypothetical protein